VLPVTVFFERTATFRALLANVGRFDCLDHDAAFVGFVRDVLLQFTECPLLEFLAVADALSNLLQVLERDVRTAVAFGLCNEFFRTPMQVVMAPATEPVTDALIQTDSAYLCLQAEVKR
jgi:hypothetical protein